MPGRACVLMVHVGLDVVSACTQTCLFDPANQAVLDWQNSMRSYGMTLLSVLSLLLVLASPACYGVPNLHACRPFLHVLVFPACAGFFCVLDSRACAGLSCMCWTFLHVLVFPACAGPLC
jgi:hypothetical protein